MHRTDTIVIAILVLSTLLAIELAPLYVAPLLLALVAYRKAMHSHA